MSGVLAFSLDMGAFVLFHESRALDTARACAASCRKGLVGPTESRLALATLRSPVHPARGAAIVFARAKRQESRQVAEMCLGRVCSTETAIEGAY
jgi:hypothetical protein